MKREKETNIRKEREKNYDSVVNNPYKCVKYFFSGSKSEILDCKKEDLEHSLKATCRKIRAEETTLNQVYHSIWVTESNLWVHQ